MLGSRFQERFFLLRGRCLLLLKEKKVTPQGERGAMLGGQAMWSGSSGCNGTSP